MRTPAGQRLTRRSALQPGGGLGIAYKPSRAPGRRARGPRDDGFLAGVSGGGGPVDAEGGELFVATGRFFRRIPSRSWFVA